MFGYWSKARFWPVWSPNLLSKVQDRRSDWMLNFCLTLSVPENFEKEAFFALAHDQHQGFSNCAKMDDPVETAFWTMVDGYQFYNLTPRTACPCRICGNACVLNLLGGSREWSVSSQFSTFEIRS